MTWNGAEFCVERACDPCSHVVLYFTGQDDLGVWCEGKLLVSAWRRLEPEDASADDRSSEELAEQLLNSWFWENRQAVTAFAPKLLKKPIALYQIPGMPVDDFLAVVDTEVVFRPVEEAQE